MKNLTKTFAISAALIISSLNIYANTNDEPKSDKTLNSSVVENVIDQYINTSVKGDISFVDEIFGENFTQRFNAAKDQKAIQKVDYVKYLVKNEGIQYNCDVHYELVEKDPNYTLARVILDFGNFKRVDYVSIKKNMDNNWKVSDVNSTYRN